MRRFGFFLIAALVLAACEEATKPEITALGESPLFQVATPAIVSTFTVNSTDDVDDSTCNPTHCSLREAIDAANALPGLDGIVFSIPALTDGGCDAITGVCTIQPASALPEITDPVIIDGYTQPGALQNTNGPGLGSNADLKIELNGFGAGAGGGVPGLFISAGGSTVKGLVINRFFNFNGSGIVLGSNGGNFIEGNFIGTDVNGTGKFVGNTTGVLISGTPNNTIGGTTPGARNVISGNISIGVLISAASATDNLVQGNLIGTDLNGTTALGNGGAVVGDGVAILGGVDNIIGGTTDAERNIISSNTKNGVRIAASGTGNRVEGNFIGTDVSGTLPLGNFSSGVLISNASDNIVGGTTADKQNIISGNNTGVRIDGNPTTGNRVEGNFIGPDVNGTALGNGTGVFVFGATNSTIGGTMAGAGNVISGNNKIGVEVLSISASLGNDNAILSNSIFSNGGLGIDLVPCAVTGMCTFGVTPNDVGDGDAGPNDLQNFPVLTTVTLGSTTIQGTLNSTANTTFRLEFFSNTAADPSGNGEGESFIGSANVMTDGSGNVSFTTVPFSATVSVGEFISATATDPNNNTSEFSEALEVVSLNAPPVANANGPYDGLEGSPVTLDGTGSSDPDGDALTFFWSASASVTFDDPTSATPTATFPVGATTATLTVTDPFGESNMDDAIVTVISRQDATQNIMDDVQALVTGGALTGPESGGLIRKLENAIRKLDEGKVQPAISMLQDFIDQVSDFITAGKLTAAEGQPLIDAAQAIIDGLTG